MLRTLQRLVCSHHRLRIVTQYQHDHQRRSLLTVAIEPPPQATERPCTLILAQDTNLNVLYSRKSDWSDTFAQKFPTEYGMPTASWSLSPSVVSFDDAVSEMKRDLSNCMQPILVARGPWVSWMAQFYLESMPLAALILVDPLPFNDTASCRLYEKLLSQEENKKSAAFVEYRLFQDYVQHTDHWTLQLEPAVIPMLVLSSRNDWHEPAVQTAARHSEDDDSSSLPVPVMQITNDDHDEAIARIGNWILQEDIL